MRTCNGCTLCCHIERVPVLQKPSNSPCRYCRAGTGCMVHGTQTLPKVCKDFFCGWLTDENMGEDMRPDRVHLYVYGKINDEVLKISVDPNYPDAWKQGLGAEVVNHFRNKFHVLVVVDKQINFLCGIGKTQPEKLIVDWLL